jgi:hypothetical protein
MRVSFGERIGVSLYFPYTYISMVRQLLDLSVSSMEDQ